MLMVLFLEMLLIFTEGCWNYLLFLVRLPYKSADKILVLSGSSLFLNMLLSICYLNLLTDRKEGDTTRFLPAVPPLKTNYVLGYILKSWFAYPVLILFFIGVKLSEIMLLNPTELLVAVGILTECVFVVNRYFKLFIFVYLYFNL